MIYIGYKSEHMVVELITKQYPKFSSICRNQHDFVHTDISLIRIIAKRVEYNIDLHNLSHFTGRARWIPADRDKELNGLLNHIEQFPEIVLFHEL